ncbi:protein TolQ [Acetobacteraceae bacterium]|nr:protein TolQ [Acetobacteraceae bacterium]
MHASVAVKFVMATLLLFSILVWAIVFQKSLLLIRVNKEANQFEEKFWSGASLDQLYEEEGSRPVHPIAAIFSAAMGEWRRSSRIAGINMSSLTVRERIEQAISVTISRESERLGRNMVFLATVGPVAPFIGLFGTVWGIMVSFQAIGQMHSTNLSVVAPGISEALFATAIGLVTAIPAYMAYNFFSAGLSDFEDRMDAFGTEFAAILSRQAEEPKSHKL